MALEERILVCRRCQKRFQRESVPITTCKACGDTTETCQHVCCPHCGYSWSLE